jgi:hypothetical protein
MGGNSAAQLGLAGHWRVLVRAVPQHLGRRLADGQRAVFVGEALAEIYRTVLGGERRHHGEDRGAERAEHRIGITACHVR